MRIRRLTLLLLALATPAASAAPEQVHLGIPTEDPATSRSVLWLEPTPRADARVVLVTPDGEREVAAEAVEGPSAGVAYEARLEGLAASAEYGYRIDDRSFRFRTPPAALAETGSFSFVVIGDMGTSPEARAAVDRIRELDPDFVLHCGDLSYAEGRPAEWKLWFDMVEPFAAQRPWITALGNHETYTGTFVPFVAGDVVGAPALETSPLEIAFYKQRFGLPGNELWYSFNWAGVHFVALDTFSTGGENSPIPPEELAWLERDLADHANATWTVVFLHEPPYSSNAAHGSSERVQEAFVPLFEAHGVDLVFAAHDHDYERTYPLRGGARTGSATGSATEGDGVAYFVTGGGGERLYPLWDEPAPPWSAAREALHHVVHVTVTPTSIETRVVPTAGVDFTDTFRMERVAGVPPDGAAGDAGVPGAGIAVLLVAGAAGALLRRRT